jgi:O-antigen ligase
MERTRAIKILDLLLGAGLTGWVGSMPVSIAFCQVSLFVAWLAFLSKCVLTGKWPGFRTKADIGILVFIAASIASAAFSSDPGQAFSSFKKFYLLSGAYLTAFTVADLKRSRELVWLFCGMSLLTALAGLWQVRYTWDHRLLGVQGMAMTSGGIYMMAFLMAVSAFMVRGETKKVRVFSGIMGGLLFCSLLLTRTVTSWAGGLAGLFVLLAAARRKWAYAGLALVLVLGVFSAQGPLKKQFQEIKERKESTWGARLTIWRIGWEIFREHPLLGTGQIDLGKIYQTKRTPEDISAYGPQRCYGHLHNNFLQILATMGLAGLSAFCFMLYRIILLLYSAYNNSGGRFKPYAAGLLAVFAGFLVNGLGEWNYSDSEVITIVWFLVGLAMAADQGSFEEIPASKPSGDDKLDGLRAEPV